MLACWRVGDEWCVGVGLSVGVGRWYGCRGCWMSGVGCSDGTNASDRPVLLREYFSRSPRLTSAYSSTHLAIASDSTQPSSRSSILCLPPLPVRPLLCPLHSPSTPPSVHSTPRSPPPLLSHSTPVVLPAHTAPTNRPSQRRPFSRHVCRT